MPVAVPVSGLPLTVLKGRYDRAAKFIRVVAAVTVEVADLFLRLETSDGVLTGLHCTHGQITANAI